MTDLEKAERLLEKVLATGGAMRTERTSDQLLRFLFNDGTNAAVREWSNKDLTDAFYCALDQEWLHRFFVRGFQDAQTPKHIGDFAITITGRDHLRDEAVGRDGPAAGLELLRYAEKYGCFLVGGMATVGMTPIPPPSKLPADPSVRIPTNMPLAFEYSLSRCWIELRGEAYFLTAHGKEKLEAQKREESSTKASTPPPAILGPQPPNAEQSIPAKIENLEPLEDAEKLIKVALDNFGTISLSNHAFDRIGYFSRKNGVVLNCWDDYIAPGFHCADKERWLRRFSEPENKDHLGVFMVTISGRNHVRDPLVATKGRKAALEALQLLKKYRKLRVRPARNGAELFKAGTQIGPSPEELPLAIEYSLDQGWIEEEGEGYAITKLGADQLQQPPTTEVQPEPDQLKEKASVPFPFLDRFSDKTLKTIRDSLSSAGLSVTPTADKNALIAEAIRRVPNLEEKCRLGLELLLAHESARESKFLGWWTFGLFAGTMVLAAVTWATYLSQEDAKKEQKYQSETRRIDDEWNIYRAELKHRLGKQQSFVGNRSI